MTTHCIFCKAADSATAFGICGSCFEPMPGPPLAFETLRHKPNATALITVAAVIAWPLIIGGCWALARGLDALKYGVGQ